MDVAPRTIQELVASWVRRCLEGVASSGTIDEQRPGASACSASSQEGRAG